MTLIGILSHIKKHRLLGTLLLFGLAVIFGVVVHGPIFSDWIMEGFRGESNLVTLEPGENITLAAKVRGGPDLILGTLCWDGSSAWLESPTGRFTLNHMEVLQGEFCEIRIRNVSHNGAAQFEIVWREAPKLISPTS